MKTYKEFIEESFSTGLKSGIKSGFKNVSNTLKTIGNLPTTTASTLGKKLKQSGIEASTTKNNSDSLTKGQKRFKIGSALERLGN
jgi:hypothetical protein